jgi:hypothetical protein
MVTALLRLCCVVLFWGRKFFGFEFLFSRMSCVELYVLKKWRARADFVPTFAHNLIFE